MCRPQPDPLAVVTTNPGKAASFSRLIAPHPTQAVSLELVEPQEASVAAVAMSKAEQAYRKLQRPLVVEDGGLVIPSLGEWPGAYTKPFLHAVGIDGLFRLLGARDPSAYFDSAVVYYDADGPIMFAGPSMYGRLVRRTISIPDHAWSSLWEAFMPAGADQVLAELDTPTRNSYAPEDDPLRQFARWWHGQRGTAL